MESTQQYKFCNFWPFVIFKLLSFSIQCFVFRPFVIRRFVQVPSQCKRVNSGKCLNLYLSYCMINEASLVRFWRQKFIKLLCLLCLYSKVKESLFQGVSHTTEFNLLYTCNSIGLRYTAKSILHVVSYTAQLLVGGGRYTMQRVATTWCISHFWADLQINFLRFPLFCQCVKKK